MTNIVTNIYQSSIEWESVSKLSTTSIAIQFPMFHNLILLYTYTVYYGLYVLYDA